MNVTKSFTIGRQVVTECGKFLGCLVFQSDDSQYAHEDRTLFFCRDTKVVGKMTIQTGMGQGCGYIAGIDMEDVK